MGSREPSEGTKTGTKGSCREPIDPVASACWVALQAATRRSYAMVDMRLIAPPPPANSINVIGREPSNM
jgi:hypothetical protein